MLAGLPYIGGAHNAYPRVGVVFFRKGGWGGGEPVKSSGYRCPNESANRIEW